MKSGTLRKLKRNPHAMRKAAVLRKEAAKFRDGKGRRRKLAIDDLYRTVTMAA